MCVCIHACSMPRLEHKPKTLLSFIAVAMNSRDRYEIIGLREISHSINNLVETFA